MPSFISKEGVWEPAPEYTVDPKAEKGKEVYEGPDRAALSMLKELGVDHLGMHYSADPEMVMRARQMGFTSVDEYLKMYNYDSAKAKAAYEAQKAVTVVHADPEKKPMGKFMGGGQDSSGGSKSREGGFELPADVPGK